MKFQLLPLLNDAAWLHCVSAKLQFNSLFLFSRLSKFALYRSSRFINEQSICFNLFFMFSDCSRSNSKDFCCCSLKVHSAENFCRVMRTFYFFFFLLSKWFKRLDGVVAIFQHWNRNDTLYNFISCKFLARMSILFVIILLKRWNKVRCNCS